MRTQPSFVPTLLFRWLIVTALLATTVGQTLLTPAAIAQDDAAADPLEQIAALVPAHATALATISTVPESVQWPLGADLLARGGLEDLVYGLIAQLMRETGLSSANLIPGQSNVLGGSIAVAGWGDASNPLERGVFYISASDPEAAYRSVVAQLLTEGGEQTTEIEVPGGRLTQDEDGFTGVLLINEIVVVSDADTLTTVWQLVTGAGPTLAQFAPFADIIAAQDPSAIARVYVNGPGIGQGLLPLMGNVGGLGWQELILLGPALAQAATYLSLGLTAAEDGFHLRVAQLPAPLVGQATPTDPSSSDPAERVSAETDVFAGGTDLGAHPIVVQYVNSIVFGLTVGSGFTEFDPSGPATVDDALDGLAQATGIDIRTEILGQLQGDFVLAAAPATVGGSQSADVVLVSGLADEAAMRDTLNQIVGALRLVIAGQGAGAELTEVPVGEDSLYVISTLDDAAGPVSVSFGLIGDELVLAFGDGYSRLLDPDDNATLASDARYQAARAAASEEAGQVLYFDLHDLIDLTGVESIDPPDPSVLPGGSRSASIDGIQALAAVTFDDGDLTISDAVLTIDQGSADQDATPADPEIPADATPEASSSSGVSFTGGGVEVVDTNGQRVTGISPSGEYMLIEDRDANIACLVPFDDPGGEVCTAEFRGVDDGHLAWSPDGASVAFTEESATLFVDGDVWIINAAAGTSANLTDDGFDGGIPLISAERQEVGELAVDNVPIFSADGESIYFSRTTWNDSDVYPTEIYRVGVDGGEAEKVATVGQAPFVTWGGVTWVDDSTLLYSYSAPDPDDPNNGLWTLDVTSGEMDQVWAVTDEAHTYPMPQVVSPDGKLVLSFPAILGSRSTDEVCGYEILDLESGGAEPLVDADGNCALMIGMSPDGRHVLFRSIGDNSLTVLETGTGALTVLDTGALADAALAAGDDSLTLFGPNLGNFVWTNDNRVFFQLTADVMVAWQLVAGSQAPDASVYVLVRT